ncbi:MAG: alpha/beta hydrolase, partial [Bacteroidota bacterium]
MKKLIKLSISAILTLLFQCAAYSQFCTLDNRFTEVEFFNDDQISSEMNVVYGNADGQDLAMDVYFPSQENEDLSERPFIMLFHGGSFIGGDRSMMTSTCLEFAKRGFVAATVSYRLSDQLTIPARYKGSQDGHAAMRYIVENADQYGIDTDWLFTGGDSAGSIIAISMVFDDQQEWQNRDQMNDLMGDYGLLYSNGNDLENTYQIQGVMNNWGSAYIVALDE